MPNLPSWHVREVGKLYYPKLKGDKLFSHVVTLDQTCSLAFIFEPSLQEYLRRAFVIGHDLEQAKHGKNKKSSQRSYRRISTISVFGFENAP